MTYDGFSLADLAPTQRWMKVMQLLVLFLATCLNFSSGFVSRERQ